MALANSLYGMLAGQIVYDVVQDFVLDAEAADLLTESFTVELQRQGNKENVAAAGASLGNIDGGPMLVGVSEEEVEARFKSISRRDFDAHMAHLHQRIPELCQKPSRWRFPP